MRSINRSDFPPYTDIYTKYCPHCGVKFFSDRNSDVFCTSKCYQQHYSLLQRSENAQTLSCFKLPIQRKWSLQTKEKIYDYLFEVMRVSEYMWKIQNVSVMNEFMQIIKMKAIDEPDEDDSRAPDQETLRNEILEDLKEIINYPPAFEEPLVTIDTLLLYLLHC